MKTHFATERPNRFGGITVHTLCGRDSAKSEDGFNSSADPAEVSCKFCRKHPRFPKPA